MKSRAIVTRTVTSGIFYSKCPEVYTVGLQSAFRDSVAGINTPQNQF